MALAVLPHHMMGHAGLFGLIDFCEGNARGNCDAGNDEAGSDTTDHGTLHFLVFGAGELPDRKL